MTRGEGFDKKGKCKNDHCSAMSNLEWSDLNTKSNIIKLHVNCPNCNCQKFITFAPNQRMLDGRPIKSKLQNFFEGTQTT